MTWEGLSPPYATIVADPPWRYEEGFNSSTNTPGRKPGWTTHDKPLPYSSLTVAEIAAMPVSALAAPNARAFLWATSRYLPAAFGIMSAWGFQYRQTLVWHKLDGNVGGSIAPNSAEFLIVGVAGKPPRVGRYHTSVISHAQAKAHSVKPKVFLDLVEQVSPGPYVELFARQPRLGWDAWGYGVETPVIRSAVL